jgi:hypothetical protein
MGSGSFDSKDWGRYSASVSSMSVHEIYKSRGLDPYLDPKDIKVREARDSDEHPNSTAIIIDFDVTGSMGMIAENIAKEGLGKLFQEILDRKPVADPQLMFMANGDGNEGGHRNGFIDSAPLQVSQFESSNIIIGQMEKIWVEGGGGGNGSESYDLPWYFAAKHTSIDCFEKRGKKGYLFTIGDEPAPLGVSKATLKYFLDDDVQVDKYSPKELLAMAEQKYHVFHVLLTEGGGYSDKGEKSWKDLMGQHVLVCEDYTKMAEIIVSTIQVIEGESVKAVTDSWDGSTAVTVGKAIKDLASGPVAAGGVVTL